MKSITSIESLEGLYDAPLPSPLAKVKKTLTPNYRKWISLARLWYGQPLVQKAPMPALVGT